MRAHRESKRPCFKVNISHQSYVHRWDFGMKFVAESYKAAVMRRGSDVRT